MYDHWLNILPYTTHVLSQSKVWFVFMAGCECVHVSVLLYEFRLCLGWQCDIQVQEQCEFACLFVFVRVLVFVLCACVLCACVCAHSGEHCTCFDILAPAQCLTLALSASSNHSFCTPCHALEVMTVIIFPDCFNSDSDNIDDVYESQCSRAGNTA